MEFQGEGNVEFFHNDEFDFLTVIFNIVSLTIRKLER